MLCNSKVNLVKIFVVADKYFVVATFSGNCDVIIFNDKNEYFIHIQVELLYYALKNLRITRIC